MCQMWDSCMMSATHRPVVSPCHLQMLTACSWHSSRGNLRVTCPKKNSPLILQVTEPTGWQSSHSLPLGHPPSVAPLEANLQRFATFTKKGPSMLLSSDLLTLVPTPVPKFPTLLVFFSYQERVFGVSHQIRSIKMEMGRKLCEAGCCAPTVGFPWCAYFRIWAQSPQTGT